MHGFGIAHECWTPAMWHYFALAASEIVSMAICAVTMVRTLARDTSALDRARASVDTLTAKAREENEAAWTARMRVSKLETTMQTVYAILGSCDHAPKVAYPEAPWGMCLGCVVAACEQVEKAIEMPGGASMRARWTQKRGLE